MKIHTLAASVAALTVASTVATGVGPANAAAISNPSLDAARTWLVSQIGASTSDHAGLLPSSYGGANYGASADAIISLASIGDTADATTIGQTLASHIDSYISGDDQDPSDDAKASTTYEDVDSTYAGSAAKAAVALRMTGGDPATIQTHLGGKNAGTLIQRLEAQVQPSGRIHDTSAFGDYENVLGQSFAVNALTAAGSAKAASATTFLLSQQCKAGWFRQGFDQITDASKNPLGTDESCDADGASTPSVDATATALLNLAPQVDDGTASDAVKTAVADAKTWLLSVQGKDGGWSDGGAGDAENANSTGLAAFALGQLDPADTAPAGTTAAATWLAAHQLQNAGVCDPYKAADLGAIAYDDKAWTAAQKAGVAGAVDQFVVAAAQALPALAFPTAPATQSPAFVVPTVAVPDFHKGGSTMDFGIAGLQGAGAQCASDGTSSALVEGNRVTAGVKLKLRKGTGSQVVRLTPSGDRRTIQVLGKAHLRVSAPKTVADGRRLVVRVRGLVKGERYAIRLRGKKLVTGPARGGSFTKSVKVTGAKGRTTLVVTGQYSDRKGSAPVTVK